MHNSISILFQRRVLQVGIALAGALTGVQAHAADFVNGQFNSGLSGWLISGAVSAQGDPFGLGVLSGTQQAILSTASNQFQDDFPQAAGVLNYSSSETSSADVLEAFLGLPAYRLSYDGGDAFEGSSMLQTLSLAAGDTLSFKWRFLTADALKGDYAFVMINGQRTVLADLDATSLNGSLPNQLFASSAASTFGFMAPSAGLYKVAVGVVDQGDFVSSSILTVDHFQVQAVPEPAEYALLLAGLAVVGVCARKRHASTGLRAVRALG